MANGSSKKWRWWPFLALVGDALKPLWGSHALYRSLMASKNPKRKGNLLNYWNAKYI
jgi:hypothetical protein